MAEDKNYTNNTERPREDEEVEIDLMEYVRKLWKGHCLPNPVKAEGGACREWLPCWGSEA